MQTQNRNGVLGLETAKQVMVAFLVLAVTAVAILLSLTALDDSIGDSIDNTDYSKIASNETGAYINATEYTLGVVNSSTSGYTITAVWNSTPKALVLSGNYSVSALGNLTNLTESDFSTGSYALNVSYTYIYTVDSGTTDSIIGNVSDGLVTFFASTGTIFSILIVVVIILAISIIIWAVGRFGQQTEGTVNL